MGFNERIDEIKHFVEHGIQTIFLDREPQSLYRPMFHLLEGGGKYIRPMLLMLSCQAVGGRIENCLHAAMAVEILHTFTLVHDDIMDHDDIRRGRPTVHKMWDEPTAILAGDGLVTMAYQTLLKTNHSELMMILRIFTDGLLILCEGQALDKAFEARENVTVEEYENMIEKKTARLIEVACTIGAILGEAGRKEKECLMLFGRLLGKAFQVQDDILDILSEESISGKPLGSDIVEKKKTYLTIHFAKNASIEEKRCYRRFSEKDILEKEDISKIRELYKQAGSFQMAQRFVDDHIARALECLDGLKDLKGKEDLKNLALFIQNRTH